MYRCQIVFVLLSSLPLLSGDILNGEELVQKPNTQSGELKPDKPLTTTATVQIDQQAENQENDVLFAADFKIPILTIKEVEVDSVSAEAKPMWVGSVSYLEMEYERKNDKRPFRIAISEENPGTSGAEFETSFWQAAVVAALHEQDDLAGVRVTFVVPEELDGASAGGVIAVALLSALNKKELPQDFAFTGKILPDGTVGQIGGVVEKIRAAEAEGFKRILIPQYMRAAEELSSGKYFDLHKLTQGDVAVINVDDLASAYQIVHRLPQEDTVEEQELKSTYAEEFEHMLMLQTLDSLEKADKLWLEIPEEERSELQSNEFVRQAIILPYHSAKAAFESGRFYLALHDATSSKVSITSLMKARRLAASHLEEHNRPLNLEELNTETAARWKQASEKVDGFLRPLAGTIPEVASQLLMVAISASHEIQHVASQIRYRYEVNVQEIERLPLEEIPAGETTESMQDKLLEESASSLLLLSYIYSDLITEYETILKPQIAVFDKLGANLERVTRVENFFYTGARSISNSIKTNIVEGKSEEWEVAEDKTIEILLTRDPRLFATSQSFSDVTKLHSEIKDLNINENERVFKSTLNTLRAAEVVADFSGILVRWNELGLTFDDADEIVYEQTNKLSDLIRKARKNAILRLNECAERRIPCPVAIYRFEIAETARDDPEVDKVEVLSAYWKATLSAQSLLMIFDGK